MSLFTTRIIRVIFFLLLCVGVSSIIFPQHTVISQPSFVTNTNVWLGAVRKLTAIPNTFSLHKPLSLIPMAQAAGSYAGASAYIAIDEQTGQILAESDADTPLSIASLTKIMTAVVALDLAKANDPITISENAAIASPTKIGVVPGSQMSVEELLHGMLMTSANDAAQAVADGIDSTYGQQIFINAMNEKARFLGLSQTHFANPQGFDDVHNKSSAHDLAVLSSYALSHYPLLAQIVQKDYLYIPATTTHKQFDLYNWNGLLDVYPGVAGMKIGNTGDAGYTTIVSSTREGHTILVVVLGAPGIIQRDMWASQLLDDTFADTFGLSPVQITTTDLQKKYATWQYWN